MNLVMKTLPIHLTTKVPLDSDIEVTFIFDINKDTVNVKNVILFNLAEQKGEPISVAYSNRVLKILSARRLQPLTHYQVQLLGGIESQGIRDITGRALDQNYKFEFHTGEELRISTPQLLLPTDLSEINEDALFTWKPVDQADYYELQISRSNTFDVLEWPTEEVLIFKTEVVPEISYERGITYYARLRAVNDRGVKSAFTTPIRYHYSGINRAPIKDQFEEIRLSYVKTLEAKEGELYFRLEKPYKPGIGQLSVYINGLKGQPCSDPSVVDGEYREVDERTVVFVNPLFEGDAIEFRIEAAIKEEVAIQKDNLDALPTEIQLLQDHFINQADDNISFLEVSSTSPNNGAVMIKDASRVVLTFNQDVDPRSIDQEAIYIVSEKN